MAVMMLMTAWVFVPGEHNHASASGTSNATQVSATNTAALDSIGTFNTNVTTIHGSFESDSDYLDTQYYDAIYKNVLYTDGATTIAASATSAKTEYGSSWTGSNGVTVYWYHPTATVMYDGSTTPSLGVAVNTVMYYTGTWSRKTVNRLSYISSGGNGFTINENWHGSDGRLNFNYMWHGQGAMMGYTTTVTNDSMRQTLTGNSDNHFYANLLKFTATMSDTEFYRTAMPTFGFYGDNGDDGKTITATTGDTLAVINYKPLKAALNEALGTGTYSISTLKANSAKYTTTSVAEYVAAVKALIAAKPNNYVNSSKNDYIGYANAASAAITKFNNAKANLKLATYTLTFKSQDGTTKDYTYDYGTAINCSSLAPANSVTQGDDNGHQTYVWDVANMSLTSLVDDVTINEVADQKVAHNFDEDGDGSVDADDYTQGDTTHSLTCQECGYVKTQAHVKNSTGYVTKAETCTEDGVMTFDCQMCGKMAIATETINNIAGHEYTGDLVMNVDGIDGNHWRKCVRFDQCGTYGWGTTANGHEAHKWDKNNDDEVNAADGTVTTEPGCLTTGVRTYYCQVDGCTATYTEVVPATGHQNVTKTSEKNVANICGGHGYSAFWTCSDCGKIYTDEALTAEISKYEYTDIDGVQVPTELVIDGPAHDFSGAYANVSDGANGTHKRQCVRFTQCKTYGSEESHKYTSTTVDSTCIKAGKTTYTCSDCNASYSVDLPLKSHIMTLIPAVAPECDKAGNNAYYSCSTCGKFYKDEAGTTVTTEADEKLAALVHKWTEHHSYDTLKTPANCQVAAVYNNHCDYCQVLLTGATHFYGDPDTVNGHKFEGAVKDNGDKTHSYKCTVEGCTEYGNPGSCTYTVTEDVASTCKTAGHTTYKCTTCGNGYSDFKALDFNNHTGEGTEIKAGYAATCSSDGYTGDTYCLGCKVKIADGETIPADKTKYPHDAMTDYAAKAPTCQEEGHKAYRYCWTCGTYEIEKVTLAKKDHKFTTYTSNGDGTHTATCDTCDATVATPETDTQNCSGGIANCVDKKVCAVCNEAYGEVDANNHKTVITIAKVPSTCQTEGKEAYNYCEACDTALEEIKKIDKLEHTYGAWTQLADEDKHTRSCTTCDPDVADVATETADCNGGTAYCNAKAKCKDCKSEYGELDPDKHSTEANTLKDVVAATCQAPGFSGNYRYDCCDAIKEAGSATAQLAHTYDIEVENSRVAATCIATGEVTYKCSTCVEEGEVKAATKTETLPIDKNNHASDETVKVNDKVATCTEDGYTGDIYHKCCYVEGATDAENKKALMKKGEVIKGNGQHRYGDAAPEYLLTKDADGKVVIVDVKNDADEVIGKAFELKTSATYAEKIAARHEDGKWYHAQVCSLCSDIKYTACYTYEHTYNCVDTDTCEICEGLCSLIDPNKHDNIVKIDGVEATHTTDGKKAYYKCADCGKFFLDEAGKTEFDPESEEGKALITISKDTVPCTEWEEEPYETVDPECGKDGYKKYRCKTEGCDKVKTEVIPATDSNHTWSEEYTVTKEPTCGAVGYKVIKCEKCGTVKPNSAITLSATGEHKYVLVKTVQGENCLAPTVKYYECSVCDAEKTEEVYEDATDHSWSEWITKGGDCSTGILQERSCSVCGQTESQTINTNTHSYKLEIRVPATAEKNGYEIYKCENCGVEDRKELIWEDNSGSDDPGEGDIDFGKHTVDENVYIVHEKATCAHGEIRRYTCLTCGEMIEIETDERDSHIMLKQAAEVATCERAGHSEYDRCAICLMEVGRVDYPATGHHDGDGNGKCDSCNSAYYNDGESSKTCGCICHKENFFMQIIYKILRFFWKLFKIGHTCDCGFEHY